MNWQEHPSEFGANLWVQKIKKWLYSVRSGLDTLLTVIVQSVESSCLNQVVLVPLTLFWLAAPHSKERIKERQIVHLAS